MKDNSDVFEYTHTKNNFLNARNPDTLEFMTTAFQKALLGDHATITASNGQTFVISTKEEFDAMIKRFRDKISTLEKTDDIEKEQDPIMG